MEAKTRALARLKEALQKFLGDDTAAFAHSFRFVYKILFGKVPEADLLFLPKIPLSGKTVVDVGANGADWTYRLSKLVGPAGRVLAFEADPYYAKVTGFVLQILRCKNVTLFPFGLSDVEGHSFLQVRFDDGLRASGLGKVVATASLDTVEVSLRRLDAVAAELKTNSVSLIKCDVEGHELRVLKGATGILTQRPIVIAEVDHFGQDSKASELFAFMLQRQYIPFVLTSDSQSLEAVEAADERLTRPNRWFIPEERYREFAAQR